MKKLIYLLLFISLNCAAQKNIISASYQVIDKGYGLRYDRIIDNYGFYGSASTGNYDLLNGTVSHARYCLGTFYKFNPSYQRNLYFSFGLAYNQFWGEDKLLNISKETWEPISMEFGVGNYFGRIHVACRYDFQRNEATFDLGFIL